MVYFIYSDETASSNIAAALKAELGLNEIDAIGGLQRFSNGKEYMIRIEGRLVEADFLNNMIDDVIIFLSKHSSGKGIPSFTVHPEGNWTEDNSLGGRPKSLSVSSPSRMLGVLQAMSKSNKTGIKESYEATHHGPLLDHPSFFVELGGNDETIRNKEYAEFVAKAVASSIGSKAEYGKVAIGIGGMHYSDKFTRLAIEGKYAFAHIMSKYYASCTGMIKTSLERSDEKVDTAVIEWKSIKANEREIIVRELGALGIDYAKV
jgi:D-aminoacyl-tRNA deacylase